MNEQNASDAVVFVAQFLPWLLIRVFIVFGWVFPVMLGVLDAPPNSTATPI